MSRAGSVRWAVEEHRGPAGDHATRPEPRGRTVRILEVERPSVLLGSTQPEAHLDAARVAAAGVGVARRRSGGGAVLLVPGDALWYDVAIPVGDALWRADVGRAFHWLGAAWVDALGHLGVEARWHDGAIVHTDWSRHVCFAGLGPGEVTVDGRKVVGMSQRRTRHAALFQCCVLLRWDPGALVGLLALTPAERAAAAAAVGPVAVGLGPGYGEEALRAALLAAVERAGPVA